MTLRDQAPWVWRGLLTAAAVAVVVIGARWLPLAAGTGGSTPVTREIVLVARSMAFYADGDPTPNPTIRVRTGERIRLVLRNADSGVTHNFAVGDWRLSTRDLAGEGTDRLEFSAPATAGSWTYECTPHAAMMRGTIDVR